MGKQDYVPRLVSEFGYPQWGAELVAKKLEKLTSPIAEAMSEWWAGGPLPDIEIEGYSVKRLWEEHQQKPIAAILTLDWLNREPEEALASLARGHDKVDFSRK